MNVLCSNVSDVRQRQVRIVLDVVESHIFMYRSSRCANVSGQTNVFSSFSVEVMKWRPKPTFPLPYTVTPKLLSSTIFVAHMTNGLCLIVILRPCTVSCAGHLTSQDQRRHEFSATLLWERHTLPPDKLFVSACLLKLTVFLKTDGVMYLECTKASFWVLHQQSATCFLGKVDLAVHSVLRL
jgi:hypothetical protein